MFSWDIAMDEIYLVYQKNKVKKGMKVTKELIYAYGDELI